MARRSLARRLVVAGAVLYVARLAVTQAETKPGPVELPDDLPDAAIVPSAPRRMFRRRLATSLTFATLFFAGAALSAGAGNELAHVDAASTDPAAVAAAQPLADAATTTADATTTEAVATDPPATDPTPVATPAADPTPVVTASTPAEPAPTPDPFDDAVTVKSIPTATPTPVAVTTAKAKPKAAVRPKRRAAVHVPAPAPVAIPFQALAFDPQAWLQANAASPTGAAAVDIAEHYLGVPYVWGGAMPSTGFDCSGLTAFVYAQLGVNLPHYAAAQFAAYPRLDPTQLQPGDLVFFEPKLDGPGHVALYIGNDRIIEAPHTGALIRIVSFSGTAAKLGFLGAVRPYTEAAVPSSPVGAITARMD
jgi:peptidoglycan DL-endopeptidase CwlO